MDVCMIDVTDIDCKEGDKAIIFGDELPVTILADKLTSIRIILGGRRES
jgi:Alr-MurF fusion protein